MNNATNLRVQKKEIVLMKTNGLIGITLCAGDNGQVKIRRIAPNSVAAKSSHAIKSGDIIEKINGELIFGKGHREVAAKIREIPPGTSLQLLLISMLAPFNAIDAPQHDNNKTMNFGRNGSGIQSSTTSVPAFCQCKLMEQVNKILADYYGFDRDETLTQFAVGLLYSSTTLAGFKAKVGAEMATLEMPDHIIKQIWGFRNE